MIFFHRPATDGKNVNSKYIFFCRKIKHTSDTIWMRENGEYVLCIEFLPFVQRKNLSRVESSIEHERSRCECLACNIRTVDSVRGECSDRLSFGECQLVVIWCVYANKLYYLSLFINTDRVDGIDQIVGKSCHCTNHKCMIYSFLGNFNQRFSSLKHNAYLVQILSNFSEHSLKFSHLIHGYCACLSTLH